MANASTFLPPFLKHGYRIFGALALILTGAFMFTTRGNEWIACLTIAAILELYTAFRIPQEEEKEKAN